MIYLEYYAVLFRKNNALNGKALLDRLLDPVSRVVPLQLTQSEMLPP